MTQTMTRTDIHRPSAPEFDPEGYEFRGAFDLHHEDGDHKARIAAVQHALSQGFSFHGAPHGSGQCSHCGAHIRYAALMAHPASKTILYIGETCLENRFSGTKADFDALRARAKAIREAREGLTKYEALLAKHPVLVWTSYAHNLSVAGGTWTESGDEYGYGWFVGTFADKAKLHREFTILSDMDWKARKYGELSEKQINFVENLMKRVEDAQVRLDGYAKEAESASPVTEGRHVIEGTVVSTKSVDTDWGSVLKMLVKLADGSKVYGTMPLAINAEKGDTVKFVATVKASNDDKTFGFFSRPTVKGV